MCDSWAFTALTIEVGVSNICLNGICPGCMLLPNHLSISDVILPVSLIAGGFYTDCVSMFVLSYVLPHVVCVCVCVVFLLQIVSLLGGCWVIYQYLISLRSVFLLGGCSLPKSVSPV